MTPGFVAMIGALLLCPPTASASTDMQCQRERGRIEAKHVSCKKSCEREFLRSLGRSPIDETACEDRCRAQYAESLAAFESKGTCDGHLAFAVDFGTDGSRETVRGTVRTPGGPIEGDFPIVDGNAIFEGDIVVGTSDEVANSRSSDGLESTRSATRRLTTARWPGGVIPFKIERNFPNRRRVIEAIRHWEANTPIRFVRRKGEAAYVMFRTATGCSSSVGRTGGRQYINLADGCDTGSVIHEIGHAVGLWHEQSRADRDANIIVNWSNIKDDKEYNFKTYAEQGNDGMDVDFFDFDSIMLYPSFVWDTNFVLDPNKPVMTRRDGTTFAGQRGSLSRRDIASVRYLYRKPAGSVVGLGGKCVDVTGANPSNRTPIQIWDCHGEWNQMWWFQSGNMRGMTNKCLDMPFWTNGSGVWLFDCWNGPNQRFNMTSVEVRTTGGNCVSATPGGSEAQLRACNPSAAEKAFGTPAIRKWSYTPNGEIRSSSGLCLDVYNSDTRNGTPVVAQPCNGAAKQKWALGPNGRIRGLGGKCLDVRSWEDDPGTLMQIWDCIEAGTNQAFTFRGQISEPGGKCLDIPNNTANGTPVNVWDCHSGNNQKFEFFP